MDSEIYAGLGSMMGLFVESAALQQAMLQVILAQNAQILANQDGTDAAEHQERAETRYFELTERFHKLMLAQIAELPPALRADIDRRLNPGRTGGPSGAV